MYNAALWNDDGSTYHLGAKKGEVYNNIVIVGPAGRAALSQNIFDEGEQIDITSKRAFTIHSGTFKGVKMSVISIGMGVPMVDFFLREAALITEGDLNIIRVGTCGMMDPDLEPGTIVVASKGSLFCYRNYAHWDGASNHTADSVKEEDYIVTKPAMPSKFLTDKLIKCLSKSNLKYVDGLNASGETFYASQGRDDPNFDDRDKHKIIQEYERLKVTTLEMETYYLFHLAAQAKQRNIHTAAMHVGIVNRERAEGNILLPSEELQRIEVDVMVVAMKTLADLH